MKLTKRELWLMKVAYDSGRSNAAYPHYFKKWIEDSTYGEHRTVEATLAHKAPKENPCDT